MHPSNSLHEQLGSPSSYFGSHSRFISLCSDKEGWGPLSPDRYDLTICFEYSVLFGISSVLGILGLLGRLVYLKAHGRPHCLGRTAWIFWPTQIAMSLAAAVAWTEALRLILRQNVSFVAALGWLGMGSVWALTAILNPYEHKYEIRSSSTIFLIYPTSIIAALLIIHTTLDQSSTEGSHNMSGVWTLCSFTAILTVGFVVEAWPRGSTLVQKSSSACEYDKANLFSRLSMHFFQPVVDIGVKGDLKEADVSNLLPETHKTKNVYHDLSSRWAAQIRRQKTNPGFRPSLFKTILRTHLVEVVPIVVIRFLIMGMSYILPALLGLLLTYLEEHESKPVSYGITLASLMFLDSLFVALLFTYNRFLMFLLNVSIKTSLTSMIYRKSLKLSPGSRQISTTGEIVNHISQDTGQWGDGLLPLSTWAVIPVEIAVALVMLYRYLGWSMIAGVMAMVVLLPLQTWQARIFKGMQGDKLAVMDQRVRLTAEVLSGIKVVKLYGWEPAFLTRILDLRKMELSFLKRIGAIQALMSIVFISSSLIISFLTFAVYALWGGPGFTRGELTPQKVFVSMALFALLRNPISGLSDTIVSTISIAVSTRRIQEFLMRQELNEDGFIRCDHLPKDPRDPLISIKDATFSWKDDPAIEDLRQDSGALADETLGLLSDAMDHRLPALQSINLSIHKGSLTAIVGRVGQGKSSLLSAMIGEMNKIKGKVQISGTIGFVPQTAWVLNATLKDNIIFGNDYDEEKYKFIIFACGLEPDLAILPAGDLTEIGERGINLSGGQKQRVSLARAAYVDADIYLLDDPLSAVDAHVDRHLWQHLLGPTGLLRNKTRVLVTHGIHHLSEADQIVVLKDGMITENGAYGDLMAAEKAFHQLIKEYSITQTTRPKKAMRRKSSASVHRSVDEAGIGSSVNTLGAEEIEQAVDGIESSEEDEGTETDTEVDNRSIDKIRDTKAELITAEKMKQGGVGLDVGLLYARALSYRMVALLLGLSILAQACLVGTTLWVKHWIQKSKESREEGTQSSLVLFLGVYSFLTLMYVLLYMLLVWVGFAVARIRASEILHRELLAKILHLPMSFFDTTPLGRILNLFSGDINMVDQELPSKGMDGLYFMVTVSSTFIMILFTTPVFFLVLPFLLYGYWRIQNRFTFIASPIIRIYSASRSPIFQHLTETLNGVSTLRAMRVQDRFIETSSVKADIMANGFLARMTVKRWVEVELRLLSTFVLLFAALLAVLGRRTVDPGMAGLTLMFAMSVTEDVTSLVRMFCDFQNYLLTVERMVGYTELPIRAAPESTDICLPPQWPQQGQVTFKNFSTRYREGMDIVLKHISIHIQPSQKVGIVGRTGAGKSSLTLALFRIIEAADSYWAKASAETTADETTPLLNFQDDNDGQEDHGSDGGGGGGGGGGSIEIDGIDISTLGLYDLRQHLAIIPQDPILFAGTVRDNLDPFQLLPDIELWEALDRSHLKTYIQSLPGGLSFQVSQNGDNFSVGQRSLICLARALLRKTKILVLDEATAAVDVETDELIQRTIREEFKDRTVLTIAHRIKTIMDSDMILVLEKGRVEEFDTPKALLAKQGLFYSLAQQAGEV